MRGRALAELRSLPHGLKPFSDETDPEMAALLAECNVLVWGTFKETWRRPGNSALRLVHSTGAGTDGIDFSALPAECRVCNVYGHERGVAEHAFLLMIALGRGLRELDRNLRAGNWTPARPYLPEMRGRGLLVLGFGHIGREIARWGVFLDMKVTVLTRRPDADRARESALQGFGSLADLGRHLPAADFVVVAIPAAEGTMGLLGAREFGLMKPESFVVNVGRGPVIDEQALYDALQRRRIAGAGLDVWWQYPAHGQDRMPSRLPFHELDNVIMTPHKPTRETMSYRWREIARTIERFARGEALERVVHPPI